MWIGCTKGHASKPLASPLFKPGAFLNVGTVWKHYMRKKNWKKEMWTYHKFWSVLHLGLWHDFWRTSSSCEHWEPFINILGLWLRFGHRYCNRPGVLDAPVSMGTGPSKFCSFVLPPLVPCTISIGAVSCSLAKALTLWYRCPLSCSLFCIGMMCGGPCSSPDY